VKEEGGMLRERRVFGGDYEDLLAQSDPRSQSSGPVEHNTETLIFEQPLGIINYIEIELLCYR